MANPVNFKSPVSGLVEQMGNHQISDKLTARAVAQLKEYGLSVYEGRVKENGFPIRCVRALRVLQAEDLLQENHLERVFASNEPDDCAIALKTLKAAGLHDNPELASLSEWCAFENRDKISFQEAIFVCANLNAVGRFTKEYYSNVLLHSNPLNFAEAHVELHKYGILISSNLGLCFLWKEPLSLAVILGVFHDEKVSIGSEDDKKEIYSKIPQQKINGEHLRAVIRHWRSLSEKTLPSHLLVEGKQMFENFIISLLVVPNFNSLTVEQITDQALFRMNFIRLKEQASAAARS